LEKLFPIKVLVFVGGATESTFRLEKRLESICQRIPEVKGLIGRYIYLTDCEDSLSDTNFKALKDLLGSETVLAQEDDIRKACQVIVIPRIGTLSPWATKATEIARRCHLDNVKTIERGIIWEIEFGDTYSTLEIAPFLHDPMTQSVVHDGADLMNLFDPKASRQVSMIEIIKGGLEVLARANQEFSFALSNEEMHYLLAGYQKLGRDPTDAELMMFAQVNSEHCRHKIFNAVWTIDGQKEAFSMLEMIQSTQNNKNNGTLVAYNDNAAVIRGPEAAWFLANSASKEYEYVCEPVHLIAKVETHNHPTGISPFSGAATGSGGEIRDEGATGRGGTPKAGITGFCVSDLRLPGASRPWELEMLHPSRLATPLEIMIEAPVGAASFNNEFGRPNIGGFFRTLEVTSETHQSKRRRGYHKPIMLAGGVGNIRSEHVKKLEIAVGAQLIILGGPGMLIGVGGGAASSLTSGSSTETLDFASVQRDNPEMQRRCQEVINSCIALGAKNPILSIHDVGAGGLCNALPELVDGSQRGGIVSLRDIPSDDQGMSPMEIWANEAQERYVLAISPDQLDQFKELCDRECCPYSVVGAVTKERKFIVQDRSVTPTAETEPNSRAYLPVSIDMDFLFSNMPRLRTRCQRRSKRSMEFDTSGIKLQAAIERVLRLPAVADKSFLITIGDRSVGGRVVRDPMVGPWQVPVADVGVTSSGFFSTEGEGVSIGERSPIALIDPIASGRMAVGEAITNIAASSVKVLESVKLSANWMASAEHPGEQADLFDTVRSVALDLCPSLGLSIPVGKDSLSMSSQWSQDSQLCEVVAPISLVVTAYAPLSDVNRIWTPVLCGDADTILIFIDLANGKSRLGGSALALVYGQLGRDSPDVESTETIQQFFRATRELMKNDLVLAYHDRSDGGLIVTLLEMAFAGRCGIEINMPDKDPLSYLFNEELGVIIQIDAERLDDVLETLDHHQLLSNTQQIGTVSSIHKDILLKVNGKPIYNKSTRELHRIWSETSWRIQTLRDDPRCAQEEYDSLLDQSDPGLHALPLSMQNRGVQSPAILSNSRPTIAILREQGVNGHLEMAAAFDLAGFCSRDVTMTDLLSGKAELSEYSGMVACGGFSFGDVLGAGVGWAKSILHQQILYEQFASFFERRDTFTLGVCNGCQMLAGLRELIPGSKHWPNFIKNQSEQFESRLVMVEIMESKSVLLSGLEGVRLPIVVAHGEGRAQFDDHDHLDELRRSQQVTLRYVDNYGSCTQAYPSNPNGSAEGVTGFCSTDGRITIMMPHPERVVRSVNCSWHPEDWGEFSPWLKIFENAKDYCK